MRAKEILSARLQGPSSPQRPPTSNGADLSSASVEKEKEQLMVNKIPESPTDLELHQETNPVSSPPSFIHTHSALQEKISAHGEYGEKVIEDSPLNEEQEIEQSTKKQGSLINDEQEIGSTAEKDYKDVSNNSKANTNSSTKISEKSMKSTSDKSEETNSETSSKPVEEDSPDNQ